jgi:hypothetical protein
MMRALRFVVLALALSTAFPGQSGAQTVDCTTLPNPVFMPTTTLVKSYLAEVAPTLGSSTGADRATIIYVGLGSCAAYDYIADNLDMMGTGTYWDAAGNELTCDIPAGAGIKGDFVAMDVGRQTCRPDVAPPTDTKEFMAHVEPITFVVPKNSTQTAITATEGYYIMKFGGQESYQVPPWTDPNFIVIRNPGSSTQLTIGYGVGWSGKQWSGQLTNTNQGSGNVLAKVQAENSTGNAEKTLGILSTTFSDQNRDTVKVLAFEAFDQCIGAVYPDSTPTAFDKRNVRDGRYQMFAQVRYVTRVDASGQPINPLVKAFIDLSTGVSSRSDIDVNRAIVQAGAIPTCAMHVCRDMDGAPVEACEPITPCDCFFEETVAPGSSGCNTCSDDTQCSGTEKCRSGLCEAR